MCLTFHTGHVADVQLSLSNRLVLKNQNTRLSVFIRKGQASNGISNFLEVQSIRICFSSGPKAAIRTRGSL